MKYSTLQNDIINILHSSDYNLYLKLYDENGNTTIDTDKTKWIYINNYNIMISLMDDTNPNIKIWKGTNSFNDNMKNIIQRIRELANLNGISLDINVYNNLNQRKIYNLIKYTITKNNKGDDMTESHNMDESLYKLVNVSHNTKRLGDKYLSEDMQISIGKKLLSEMFEEIVSLNSCKKLNKEIFQPLYTAKTLADIKNFSNNLDEKSKNIIKENLNNINNVCSYVRNKYLNNVDINQKKYKTLFILENAKVYSIKENLDRENIIHAYNKLVSLVNKASSGTDLLRTIKKYNLCEEFNVNKHDLINFWLYESNGNPIKEKNIFVIEDSHGNKNFFNEELKFGINALAQYINNGGSKNDVICNNIIAETIKYNDIKDFINKYYNSYSMRKYIPLFKDMFSESITKLNHFDKKLFENCNEEINYTNVYNQLVKESGIEHPALKYLAIQETINQNDYAKVLFETINHEENILFENLRPYCKSDNECANISESIINKNSTTDITITRDNAKDIATSLFNKISEDVSPVSSALFSIIHSNRPLTKNKLSFISILNKYNN